MLGDPALAGGGEPETAAAAGSGAGAGGELGDPATGTGGGPWLAAAAASGAGGGGEPKASAEGGELGSAGLGPAPDGGEPPAGGAASGPPIGPAGVAAAGFPASIPAGGASGLWVVKAGSCRLFKALKILPSVRTNPLPCGFLSARLLSPRSITSRTASLELDVSPIATCCSVAMPPSFFLGVFGCIWESGWSGRGGE